MIPVFVVGPRPDWPWPRQLTVAAGAAAAVPSANACSSWRLWDWAQVHCSCCPGWRWHSAAVVVAVSG